MTQPLTELRQLLGRPTDRYTGEVVAIAGVNVSVSTPSGIRTVSNAGGVAIKTGDRVVVVGGVVEGKTKAAGKIPVYII